MCKVSWNLSSSPCIGEVVEGGGNQIEAVRRAQMSNHSEFEALYRREYDSMLRVAFLLLDSVEAAQEATHDAFAKVLEKWASIDEPGAYLRTCVVNRCRELQRRRRLERSRSAGSTAGYTELGARELVDALAKLPMRQRAAVVLRYYEGLPEAEVAAALQVPVGTVKSNVSRALVQLREAME